MIDKKINKDDCSGCMMCGDLCPSSAISFPSDNEGFWHPIVDYSKCTACGLCVKRCPVLMVDKSCAKTEEPGHDKVHLLVAGLYPEPLIYSAYHKNDDIRLKSTSGAAYYAFAETMLARGGKLAAVVFSDDFKTCKHVIGDSYTDLDMMYRTKYFQSDARGIYKSVKAALITGDKVLFCGCPCQSAALLCYLGRDYENLIRVDFVCRGINSPAAHQAQVRELEAVYGSKVTFFNFKNKTKGWNMLGLLVKFANGKIFFKDRYNSAWTRGYIGSNLYMRLSCEHCRFKGLPRLSDISIADFWGLSLSAEDMCKGVSLVMVNTEKGTQYFAEAGKYINSTQQALETAIKGNNSIINTPVYDHAKRKEFFQRIKRGETFSKVVFDLEGTSKTKVEIARVIMIAKMQLPRFVQRIFEHSINT